MKKIFPIVIIFAVQIAVSQQRPAGSTVVVQLNGIKQSEGQILLSLFDHEDGFPTQPQKAFKWAKAKVTSSSLIISFEGLPPGKYAIAAVHDENENEVMDTNFFGLPAEPYGISNNVTGTIIPPTFEEAKFSVTGKRDTIKIEMHP